jgi:integrase
MVRNRGGQRGSVVSTKAGQWQGHWYEYRTVDGQERRIHRTMILGSKAEMHKSEAEDKLQAHIAAIGYQSDAAAAEAKRDLAGEWTLRRYCVERFLPMRRAKWRRKSRDLYEYLFRDYILKRWGDVPLRALDRVELQAWLVDLAATKSRSFVEKCLMYTRAALEEAVDEGYLDRNPARKLSVPADTKPVDRTHRTVEEIAALLRELGNERDRLILRMLVLGGFRPHELFALRWNDIQGQQVLIDETVEKWRVVPMAKTKKSKGLVGIPAALAAELAAYRERCENALDTDFVFQSEARTHIDLKNWRARKLQPAARRAGIEKVDLRQMRRTFATLAPQAGLSLKQVSEQLRHSTIATTADVYMQPVEEALLRGLDALDDAIRKRSDSGDDVPE